MTTKFKTYIAISLAGVLILLIAIMVYDYKIEVVDVNNSLNDIHIADIDIKTPNTRYHNSVSHGYITNYEEEFATTDYSTFEEEFSTYVEEMNMSQSVSVYNAQLYDLCDKYFAVYYDSMRISPIAPMALANVETPSRANHDITWSALFPSAIVPAELMATMDVTTVASNSEYLKALSKEVSTRDRGALQMSPTYGTGNKLYNDLMSGSEASKLQTIDTSSCSTWANGASKTAGDRFYLPDVLLRLSAAFISAEQDMLHNGYIPQDDIQLLTMCFMYHHRSGVWTGKAHGRDTWNSSALAYEYSSKISNTEFVNVLIDYSRSHPDDYTISRSTAMKLYRNMYGDASKYSESELVLSYPIICLYSYVKLADLYGG